MKGEEAEVEGGNQRIARSLGKTVYGHRGHGGKRHDYLNQCRDGDEFKALGLGLELWQGWGGGHYVWNQGRYFQH